MLMRREEERSRGGGGGKGGGGEGGGGGLGLLRIRRRVKNREKLVGETPPGGKRPAAGGTPGPGGGGEGGGGERAPVLTQNQATGQRQENIRRRHIAVCEAAVRLQDPQPCGRGGTWSCRRRTGGDGRAMVIQTISGNGVSANITQR